MRNKPRAYWPEIVVATCGGSFAVSVQLLAVRRGLDSFLNLRLLILLSCSMLLFWIGWRLYSRMLSGLLDRSLAEVLKADSLTYLPIILLLELGLTQNEVLLLAGKEWEWVPTVIAIVCSLVVAAKVLSFWTLGAPRFRLGNVKVFFSIRTLGGMVLMILLLCCAGAMHYWSRASGAFGSTTGNVTVGSDTREAFSLMVPSRIVQRLSVGPETVLRFGIGLPSAAAGEEGSSVRFLVYVVDEGHNKHLLLSRIMTPSTEGDSAWSDEKVDLTAFASQRVEVEFQTLPVPGTRPIIDNWFTYAKQLIRDDQADGPTIQQALLSYSRLIETADTKYTNVLMIVVDALRPDHLGCYGYHRETSPTIDRLAKSGVVFRQAVSQATWTLPSFSSLFTAQYVSTHMAGTGVKVQRYIAFLRPEKDIRSTIGADLDANWLEENNVTLAEVLRDHGYDSKGIVNISSLSQNFLLNQGFSEYEEYFNDPETTTVSAVRWLNRNRRNKFFLLVHYIDPHNPYEPPEPFRSIFASTSEERRTEGGNTAESALSDSQLIDLYDAEIAYTDSWLDVLLSGLTDLGLADKTLVVLTSDHGEEFGDHGAHRHGHTLYDEVLRVPLIFSHPSLPTGYVVDQQVRLIDVAPTVLDILGLPPMRKADGVSLLPATKGEQMDLHAFSEGLLFRSEEKSLRTNKYKLVYYPPKDHWEIYDLVNDPAERVNLASATDVRLDELRRTLSAYAMRSQKGYHVRFNGDDQTHRMSGTMTTDGTFSPLIRYQLEETDAVSVDHEAKQITFDCKLNGDEDGFVFNVGPDTSRITLDLKIDGLQAGNVYVGPLRLRKQVPLSIRGDDDELVAAIGVSPRYQVGKELACLVWKSERSTAMTAPTLATETRERLRALGYIQ